MNETENRHDMSLMLAVHDALRREAKLLLRHLREGARGVDLRASSGREILGKALHAHHAAEDEALFPALLEKVKDRPVECSRVLALEAEHARLDAAFERLGRLLSDPDGSREEQIGAAEDFERILVEHIAHEEEVLPLVDRHLSAEEWSTYAMTSAEKNGAEAPRILPWMLVGATAERIEAVVSLLPVPVRVVLKEQWLPAYERRRLWHE